MRKFYSLIALFIMAMVANAQMITFSADDIVAAGELNGKSFSSGDITLTVTDQVDGGKVVVDANNANFGTLESYQSFTHRLKTGGKSSSKNCMAITVAKAGTLKIYARTSSKDSERHVVLTQNGNEIFNQVFVDSQAATENYTTEAGDSKTRTVFPVYSVEVEAGTIDVTYPDNGINFYAFELVADAAPAQTSYEATITSDPEDNYYSGYQAFDMQQVIAALGLANEAELQALLAAPGNVYMKLASGELTNSYTGNANEFWMNIDGVPQGFGDEGTCWYAGLYYDPAGTDEATGEPYESIFYCKVGQMPKFFSKVYTDSEANVVLVLKNGDKQIEVAITLKVNAAPKPADIPEPARNLSELTILKEYTLTMEFTEGKTDDHTVTVDMSDISDVLGVTEEAIAQNIENIFLTQGVVTDEAGSVSFSDSLSVYPFTNDGWFGRYTSFDEATGDEEAIVQNGPTRWGSGATFYLHNLALENGEFSMLVGAYTSTMKVGAEDFAELYIVAGNKAVKLTVKVNIIPLETTSFADMTKVGEQTIKAVSKPGDYAVVNVPFDLNAVKEALGIESVDEITQWVFASDDAIVDPASNNDFWQNEQGITNAWGSDACAKVYPAEKNINNGQFTLMQMAGKYTSITEPAGPFTLKYLFIVGSKYYQFNFEYTVNPNFEEEEYNIVGEDVINMQMIPSTNAYQYSKETQLDFNYFKELLGTDNFRLYGEKYSQAKGVYLDNSTTCDDGDAKGAGFWYKNDKHENKYGEEVVTGDGWGNNSFGFQLSKSGVITWFQVPNNRQVGDSFLANIYFVNEETKDAVRVKLYVKFVDEETPDVVSVGEENINIIAAEAEADGMYRVSYDMTNAIEALGIDEEELEAVQVVAPRSLFSYSYISNGEDVLFDEHGYATENEEKISSIAQIEIDGKTATITIDPMDINLDSEEATSIIVRFGFEINDKRYLQNITIGNPATGINAVNTLASAQTIYTVNGVKVAALQRGLNIIKLANGSVKKVLVK